MSFPLPNIPYVDRPVTKARNDEYKEVAWGLNAKDGKAKFGSFYINRGMVRPNDVQFRIDFCGICHTDVHFGLNHFGGTIFPVVPGHELVGTVTEIGSSVKKIKLGDKVGVGCMIDSCLKCGPCKSGEEQYCIEGNVQTYNAAKMYDRVGGSKEAQTFGGYSGSMVVDEHFVMKIPEGIPMEVAGPLFCAAITVYDPLRQWGYTTGEPKKVGIVGVGGLGTMGIKIASALGHKVYAISTSPHKKHLAKKKGAHSFVVSTDKKSMESNLGKMDIILNTISADHQVSTYLPLLKSGGRIVQLGAVVSPHQVSQMELMFSKKSICGSMIGGIKSTEECLALCAKYEIFPDVEIITAESIPKVFEVLSDSNKDGVRYVIDIQKSLMKPDEFNKLLSENMPQ